MLTTIDIENFRCIRAAHLELDPQATGIVGENGSGKTSLLESIYFLAHGRSFRANQREKLLPQADFLRVVGRIQTTRGELVAGIEYSGRDAPISPARAFPVSPRSPRSSGPGHRPRRAPA